MGLRCHRTTAFVREALYNTDMDIQTHKERFVNLKTFGRKHERRQNA